MRRSASFSDSATAAIAVWAVHATSAVAQTTHLLELEHSSPAAVVQAVGASAWGGWSGLWLAPAAGRRTTGVQVGFERVAFSDVTRTLATVRMHVGPYVQLGIANTVVGSLFDPALLDQYPELGELRVSAQQATADLVLPISRMFFSIGGKFERDELLGNATDAYVIRSSVATGLADGSWSASLAAERVVAASGLPSREGRVVLDVAWHARAGLTTLDLAVGAEVGALWGAEAEQPVLGVAARLGAAGVVSLFAGMEWSRSHPGATQSATVAVGGGISTGGLAVHARRTTSSQATAAATAFSLTLSRSPQP